MTNTQIQAYWQAYIETLPSAERDQTFGAESFGDSPELADELLALILSGTKTGTCSCLWEWEAENEALPTPGLKTIVLNGAGEPRCIIETTEVTIRNYADIDEEFAAAEGEGDLSLAYWQDAHWRYFSRVLPSIGKEPSPDMPLVCERFRVIYP